MTMLRFNQIYRLSLFYKSQVLMQFSSPNVNANIDFDCNVTKDSFGNGNSRTMAVIYNLSKDKRNILDSLTTQSKETSMQFMVEYSYLYAQQSYQLLEFGDVIGIYNELGEADYKTNIVLKSGEESLVTNYANVTYAPGTKLSQILKQQCQHLVDSRSIKSFLIQDILDYTFPNGASFVGNIFDGLSKMCVETDNTVFVDAGTLIAAASTWINDHQADQRDLNFSNGLLEPPHIGQNNFTKKFQKTQSSVAFQFKSLIVPDIRINSVISVLGQKYTIKRINHVIQSREGIGYSIVEGFKNGSV